MVATEEEESPPEGKRAAMKVHAVEREGLEENRMCQEVVISVSEAQAEGEGGRKKEIYNDNDGEGGREPVSGITRFQRGERWV